MKWLAVMVGLASAGGASAWALSPALREVVDAVQGEVRAAHRYRQAFQASAGDTNLLAEAERCYERAFAFAPVLKQIPVGQCGDVFVAGTAPDACRPTLFDAVAHDLLAFYAFVGLSGVDGGGAVLDAGGAAFEDVQGFSAAIPDEAVRRSRVLRAVRLYQSLLAFHEGGDAPTAYMDADLSRLQFCRLFAPGKDGGARYAAALDRFAHKWRKHEAASRAIALRARLALDRGEAALARMTARNGAAAFPDSVGGAQCRNLVAEIELPELAVAVPTVWRAPWPSFTVAYKNVKQVTFRAVAWDGEGAAADALRLPAAKVWTVPLPPAADFRVRDHAATVPKDFALGEYAVFASADGKFEDGGGPVFWGRVRVGGAGGGDGEGAAPVAFAPLSGAWTLAAEPDEWRYRAWRGADGGVLCHWAALRAKRIRD